MKLNELYLMDCMEGMKQFPDNYFDLAFTDPPYNVNRKYNDYDDNKTEKNYNEWCSLWFNELERISKTIVMTVGYKNLKLWLNFDPKHIIIWHKSNQNSPSPLGGFNVYEPVLYWGKTQKRIGHDHFSTNISMQKHVSWHDCPKHLNSWIKLLNMIIDKPGKIIDPFCGSGTTIIACIEEGFEYIGFEIDEDYHRDATKRINEYKSQGKLFEAAK